MDKRSRSINANIMDYENDSNYTNIIKRDIELLIPKSQRLVKPTAIIKFSKDPQHWFTLWDGNIIRKYNKQTCNNVIAMKRYLDAMFDQDLAKSVIERYDARAFMYADLISQATFAAELKQIKK